MQKVRQTGPYEVLCPRCNVTFPVGTRHCIHCGGPIGGRGLFGGGAQAPTLSPTGEPEDFDDDEMPRRSPYSPVALLWVILLGAGAVYRACTGT